jgi:transposase
MVQRYLTDRTDTEWTILAPLIPAAKAGGRPRTTDMREVGFCRKVAFSRVWEAVSH